MISLSASSQTIKDNIDKAAKDKKTRDMADKADVYIMKKTIVDSTQLKGTQAATKVSKTSKGINNSGKVTKVKSTRSKYKKKSKPSIK
jgi:hypothetical protein